MKKIFTLVMIIMAFSVILGDCANAQEVKLPDQPPPPQTPIPPPVPAMSALYYEFSGNGWKFSVNYESRFGFNSSLRVGVGYFTIPGESGTSGVYTIPILFNGFTNFLFGKIQTGVGVTLFTSNNVPYTIGNNYFSGGTTPFLALALGYRIMPDYGGILVGIDWTPFIPLNGNYSLIDNWGLSVGLTF